MTIRKTDTATGSSGTIALPPAGLPSRSPTESYWLRDPSPALLGYRGTPDLPDEADVVVVGSGITGAFAAWFLLKGLEGVVMLEAREVCFGATGRNGGHCQPLVYGSVPAVAAFELEVLEFMERFVGEEGIDCDWVSLAGVHAFFSKDMFELAAAGAEQLQQSHPELAAQLQVVGPSTGGEDSALASLRVPSAEGAIIQKKAASVWPYKLVTSVLERLVAAFPAPSFNLQTNTPVSALARAEDGAGWTLTTARGTITAPQVLLATNGYTSHLLPAFSDLIVPVRGQIGALRPPTSPKLEPKPTKLVHSYVFAADPDPGSVAPRDDYLVQTPLPEGQLIYGGGRRLARGLGVGEWRDDEVEEEVARYLRANLTPVLNLASSSPSARTADAVGRQREQLVEDDSEELELKASFEWTGIMGYSRDRHAWVGPVPESLGGGGPGGGLWICGGYTGHGMPAAALSAREVVRQMVGAKGGVEETGVRLPDEFVLDEERVARAREMPHLTRGWEATNLAGLIGGAGVPAHYAEEKRMQ
ncbi:DAO-domain-containing protein [Parathielavia hyrcaniae]|uniref:DAO-domain-containing protein n=1 Tax=Parathielavia hyrcaniae TaxID=113614 RepID=A0AAN6QB44_9PEZI|nr:DAO-domain-containing protein [Parathielavia hyrcaniae]